MEFRRVFLRSNLFNETVRVAPFVVIPGHNLYEIAVHNFGKTEIHDRGMLIANDIRRNNWVVSGLEHAFVARLARFFSESFIYFFDSNLAAHKKSKIRERASDGRHPDG